MQLALPDGATKRDHLASAERQLALLGRKLRKGPPPAPLPDALRYLWRWFVEIIQAATPGGFGPTVITWNDLAAWSALTGVRLSPWEARLLIELGLRRARIESDDLANKQRTKGS